MTVIVVTHDIKVASYLCDRAIVLEALQPELRGGVHLHVVAFDDDVDAGARPPVAAVAQVEPGVVMGDQGDPLGRAAAHDDDFHAPKTAEERPKGKGRRRFGPPAHKKPRGHRGFRREARPAYFLAP